MSAAFLLSLRHLGCDHGVPADPTATRLSRPRPGFPDRDPADPTATRLTRRHLDQYNGILAVGFSTSLLTRRRPGCSDGEPATRFSRPRPGFPDRDPVIPTATRLTRRHIYQHNGILAVRRLFPQRSRPRPVSRTTSTTMTESWLCVPAVPAVSCCVSLNVSHCLLFPLETKIFGRSSSPVLQTPVRYIVINPGHGHQL